MEDIYSIVESAMDIAFEQKKFYLKFYDYLKAYKTTGVATKEFNQSATANSVRRVADELDGYIKDGSDNDHKQLREAYGHLGKPDARKIKNYLNKILDDAQQYEKDKRRGRRKVKNK